MTAASVVSESAASSSASGLPELSLVAEQLQLIAHAAAEPIMAHRPHAAAQAQRKADSSPVTKADHEAQAIILAGLKEITPDIPIIAEEKENPRELAARGTYWLVDPLDGTREYVLGGDEFTVNIGLIVNHEPYLGLLYAPATDDMFYGDPRGAKRINRNGAHVIRAAQAKLGQAAPRLLTSRREANRLPIDIWLKSGQVSAWRICSSAYKFGITAAGEHDVFLRTGTTYEWDTAAGDAILRAAGGCVTTPDGKPLAYGKPEFRNGDFIAYGNGYAQSPFAQNLFVMLSTHKP